MEDICQRLGLDSKEDAEGVVAKAIRDGVIDAVIDHKASAVQSKEELNTYTTIEPTNAYHSRVEFCLNIYSEAVRRYTRHPIVFIAQFTLINPYAYTRLLF